MYAAFDVGTGPVQGKVPARHPSAAFVDSLDTVPRNAPRGKGIHFVVVNLSAHKTQALKDWLTAHPRGTFPLTTDLMRTLLHDIKIQNETSQPFGWRYRDVTRRMPATRKSNTSL